MCASAFLAAIVMSGGAFATAGISETFETDPYNTKLTGNGTIKEAEVTRPTVGYPISSAAHTKALEIAGTMTYAEETIASPTGASQVDFMFKVEPTDELENPTGDDIRIALAVGTNEVGATTAPIKLWCKTTSSGSAGWVDLGAPVETGSWMRATLVLDYGNSKCSVSLNGNPVLNGTDKWFNFVNNATVEAQYVQSITMVGSTMVDDFLVTHTALNNYEVPGGNTPVPGVPDGSPVTYADLNKYGITEADAKADNDVSGCNAGKISEKITAGLDPKSSTKFGLKTMTPTAANSATVTFPGSNDSGYTVKVTDAAGVVQSSVAVTSENNTGKTAANEDIKQATVTLPTDKLVYITVEATK